MKRYTVSQTVNFNGQTEYSGFSVTCVEADLGKLLALLEGGYTVMEENTSLSNTTKSDTLVATANHVSKITLGHKINNRHVNEFIKPYRGKIVLKNEVDDEALETALVNTSFIDYIPTAKVSGAGMSVYKKGTTATE
jgi:hypothetical protein